MSEGVNFIDLIHQVEPGMGRKLVGRTAPYWLMWALCKAAGLMPWDVVQGGERGGPP